MSEPFVVDARQRRPERGVPAVIARAAGALSGLSIRRLFLCTLVEHDSLFALATCSARAALRSLGCRWLLGPPPGSFHGTSSKRTVAHDLLETFLVQRLDFFRPLAGWLAIACAPLRRRTRRVLWRTLLVATRVVARRGHPSKPPERLGLDLGREVEHALGADTVPARNLMRSNESFAAFQRKLVEELSNFVAFDVQERIVGSLSGHDFTRDK
jgi:hypothetical protein